MEIRSLREIAMRRNFNYRYAISGEALLAKSEDCLASSDKGTGAFAELLGKNDT